ncbi:MAG: pantetheine-phosphate adenylyltransferase [bacterium]|nr:pantetheine-phosphate adenylyltransferase [bacterium]
MKKFNLVVCGGTFDLLHKGHREFLRFAFSKGEKAIIGLTSNSFYKNREKEKIDSYEQRKDGLVRFLHKEKVAGRTQIIKIDDVFGPSLSEDFAAEAIIASVETAKGAKTINTERKKRGLAVLQVLISPQVLAEDEIAISSSRIRQGEINREGRLYIHKLWLEHILMLPQTLRSALKKPFGRLIKSTAKLKNIQTANFVITVGDIITRELNRLGFRQKISVVDFKVSRKKRFKSLNELGFEQAEEVLEVKNSSGSITPELFKVAQKAIRLVNTQPQIRIVLKVEGEEDLAVLPLLLSAPLGWTIFYGQPQEGVVEVKVTEESKERAYKLVARFSQRLLNTRGY